MTILVTGIGRLPRREMVVSDSDSLFNRFEMRLIPTEPGAAKALIYDTEKNEFVPVGIGALVNLLNELNETIHEHAAMIEILQDSDE